MRAPPASARLWAAIACLLLPAAEVLADDAGLTPAPLLAVAGAEAAAPPRPPAAPRGLGALDGAVDAEVLLQTQAQASSGLREDSERSPLPQSKNEILHVPKDWVLNLVVVVTLAFVAIVTCVGYRSKSETGSIAMFAASYAILIPGLFSKDFSFNIAVNVELGELGFSPGVASAVRALMPNLPNRIQITQPRGKYGPIHESMRSLPGFLWQSGSPRGGVLIALFAFGMPALKLLLFGLGILMRDSKSALRARIAGWCLCWVQVVSKWAAPDMFAIIVLFHLFHRMNQPPLIESLQEFDVGFTFYSTFCMFSVLSTLGVRLPRAAEHESLTGSGPASTLPVRMLGASGVRLVALALSVAWLVLFVLGVWTPCITMALGRKQLLDQFHLPPGVDKLVLPVFDRLSQRLDAEVSLWACLTGHLGMFGESWHLNSLLAALVIVLLVLLATAFDVLAILRAAHGLCSPKGEGKQEPNSSLTHMHVLRHLSFMDVLVVGIITTVFTAEMYAEQGILLGFHRGIWYLAASEAFHWAAYVLVQNAWGR